MSFTGTIIMWSTATATIPSGWSVCDGNNGTPDLRTYFVYGAGVDGDIGTSGGSTTHSHTSPDTNSGGASHTHTYSGTSGTQNATAKALTSASTIAGSHTHSFSGTTGSGGSAHTHTVASTSSVDHNPPFIRLHYIMNTDNTNYSIPSGSIVIYYGNAVDIPSGWSIVMDEKFAMGAEVDGDVGSSTTASTHSHTQPNSGTSSHQHTESGTSSTASGIDDAYVDVVGTATVATGGHSHSYSFTTGTGNSHSHSIPATNSNSHMPEYKRLYYILKA